MHNYFNKYMKYKIKYISLKNQYGGACGDGKDMSCLEYSSRDNEFCKNIKFMLAHGLTEPNFCPSYPDEEELLNINVSRIPDNLNIITFSSINEFFSNPETFYTIFFNKKYEKLLKFLVSPKNNNINFLGINFRHHTKDCQINDTLLEFSTLFSTIDTISNVGIFSKDKEISDEDIIKGTYQEDIPFNFSKSGFENYTILPSVKLVDDIEQKKFINFLFEKYNHLFCGVRFPGKEKLYLEESGWNINPFYKSEENKILDYIFGTTAYYTYSDNTQIIKFTTSDVIDFYKIDGRPTTLFLLSCRKCDFELCDREEAVLRQVSSFTDESLRTNKSFEDYQFLYFYSFEVLLDITQLFFENIKLKTDNSLIQKIYECIFININILKNKYNEYFNTFIDSYSEENNTFINTILDDLSTICISWYSNYKSNDKVNLDLIGSKTILLEKIYTIKDNINELVVNDKINIQNGTPFIEPVPEPLPTINYGWSNPVDNDGPGGWDD